MSRLGREGKAGCTRGYGGLQSLFLTPAGSEAAGALTAPGPVVSL